LLFHDAVDCIDFLCRCSFHELIILTPLVLFFGRSLYIWIGDVVSTWARAKSKKFGFAISEAILPKFGTLIRDNDVYFMLCLANTCLQQKRVV